MPKAGRKKGNREHVALPNGSSLEVEPIPHSWLASKWPSHVAPREQRRADYIIREYRRELIACGALTRVGKNLMVLGLGYAHFLAANMNRAGLRDFIKGQPIRPRIVQAPQQDAVA